MVQKADEEVLRDVKAALKNLKKLKGLTSDYEAFKEKYKELSLDFKLQLDELHRSTYYETAAQRNLRRRVLYLTRFDLLVKPVTLKPHSIKSYYRSRAKILKICNDTFSKKKGTRGFEMLLYFLELNIFFNTVPTSFPATGKSPSIGLSFDPKVSKSSTTFALEGSTRYGPVLLESFTNDLFTDEWDIKLAFEIYNSVTYSLSRDFANRYITAKTDFSSRCLNSFTNSDLMKLLKSNIFDPIIDILMNLGYSVTVRENYDLKNDLPEKSRLTDIPNIQIQLVCDMCLLYHKPISDVDIAAFTIVVVEPSTLSSYINDFENDQGKITIKSNNMKNLFTRAVFQSIFALNNHGIITDYNNFILFNLSNEVKMETKKDNTSKKNNYVKVATSGYHSEVVNIQNGLALPKIASFLIDNVKSLVDNSEECLIRHIKEFMLDLD